MIPGDCGSRITPEIECKNAVERYVTMETGGVWTTLQGHTPTRVGVASPIAARLGLSGYVRVLSGPAVIAG